MVLIKIWIHIIKQQNGNLIQSHFEQSSKSTKSPEILHSKLVPKNTYTHIYHLFSSTNSLWSISSIINYHYLLQNYAFFTSCIFCIFCLLEHSSEKENYFKFIARYYLYCPLHFHLEKLFNVCKTLKKSESKIDLEEIMQNPS